MTIGVKTMERPERGGLAATYLPEIVKGLLATSRHFFRNFGTYRDAPTILYPEVKRPYSARFRGRHRLMKRDDGTVRCVACMCCSTACPARCITIEAEDIGDRGMEKRPRVFEIDLLLCIFCGNCVEACPCDAIRMDTGVHAPPTLTRAEHVITLEGLLADGGPSISPQGGKLR
jgi:NADH-quinone oxidoreductase subunit I